MKFYKLNLVCAFVVTLFFINTTQVSARDEASYRLTESLTRNAKEVFVRAVTAVSERSAALQSQASVHSIQPKPTQPEIKMGLWKTIINILAEPLVPLFTPRDLLGSH